MKGTLDVTLPDHFGGSVSRATLPVSGADLDPSACIGSKLDFLTATHKQKLSARCAQ